MGFRAELEQGWEDGETALAQLHTAGSCREHGCSMTLPDWQGLRNVSTGAQVGPGLVAAAPSPSELCPAWLCPPKSWWGSSVHVPSVLQCWQHSGAGCWEGIMGGTGQDVSFPFPMNTSSWECGMPGFGGTLGFALLLPLLLEWEMEAIAGKEVGRSSCCGAGQEPQLPNPGAQSRVGQSFGAGAYTVPENHLHICLQLLCPPGFAHLRQRGEMPQSCSLLELSLLCLAGMAPALGTCTTPG